LQGNEEQHLKNYLKLISFELWQRLKLHKKEA